MAQDQDFRLTRGASLKDLAQYEHDPTRNAKITRCSILLGARRHADEVLKRHSFPIEPVRPFPLPLSSHRSESKRRTIHPSLRGSTTVLQTSAIHQEYP
jgi:hypothetical protein